MNSRSVRKRLMKGRREVLWGSRAYLRVRVPFSVFPVPPPPEIPGYTKAEGWVSDGFGGLRKDEGTRTQVEVTFYLCSSSEPPDLTPYIFRVETDGLRTQYVEILKRWIDKETCDEIHREPVPKEVAEAKFAMEEWANRYVYGADCAVGHPVIDTLFEALSAAKTVYFDLDRKQEAVLLTYAVKWRYADRRAGFCCRVAKAVSLSKKRGTPIRVIRGRV